MSTSVAPQAESGISAANGLDSVKQAWQKVTQDGERQLLVLSVFAIVVALAIVLVLWTASASYRPLYGSQEQIDTSKIIEVLDAQNFDYKIDVNTGSVLVPEELLSEVRMTLAANGVKAQMPTGFENLKESAIGTSQFMEQAQYRHGLEGELARSIMSIDAVASARVHLAIPKRTLFVRGQQEQASASVLLQLHGGHKLDAAQVTAIANLVSGSVTGMLSSNVQIIDQDGQLLSALTVGDVDFTESQTKQNNYTQGLEQGLMQRASAMLDPILGKGNYQVQIAAQVNFDQIEETRESVDPQAAITQETLRSDQSGNAAELGVPGAMSNQPVTGEGAGAQIKSLSNQESRSYSVGRSIRHIKYQQMQLERLTVSLLLNDGIAGEEGWQPEQLEQISVMVQSAIGFDAERGDVLSVSNFNFLAVEEVEFEMLPWWQAQEFHTYLRYFIGLILGLALIFFVLRPLVKHLTGANRKDEEDDAADAADDQALTNEEDILAAFGLADGMAANPNFPAADASLSEKIEHLVKVSGEDSGRVAEVISHWMREKEKKE